MGVGIRVSSLVASCVGGDVDGGGGADNDGGSKGGGSADGASSGVLGDTCGKVGAGPTPSGHGNGPLCR